jgi:ABC-type lipoprotein export system ATPase subunit
VPCELVALSLAGTPANLPALKVRPACDPAWRLKLEPMDHPPRQFIDARDLRKAYLTPAGLVPALKGVNLGVARGEFVAVLGKSGAGKSTLINLLSGIDRPTAGEVWIDSVPLHEMSGEQLARWRGCNLGVVFQFFQLLPSLSLIENITLAMDFTGSYRLAERKPRALELLRQVGLADHARKNPSKISGGQQQRVAIARALANDPPLILADEPTGNLDSQTAEGVLDLFSALAQDGRTLVIVTHDGEIARRADRIVTIEDGTILEEQRLKMPGGTNRLSISDDKTAMPMTEHAYHRTWTPPAVGLDA